MYMQTIYQTLSSDAFVEVGMIMQIRYSTLSPFTEYNKLMSKIATKTFVDGH